MLNKGVILIEEHPEVCYYCANELGELLLSTDVLVCSGCFKTVKIDLLHCPACKHKEMIPDSFRWLCGIHYALKRQKVDGD